MTSLVETQKFLGETCKQDKQDTSQVHTLKPFEIEFPVNHSLAKFLATSLLEPHIYGFLGIDVTPKYTLLKLQEMISKHLTYFGDADYYCVKDKWREIFSLPNIEMSKTTIMRYIMSYIKKNNLQNPCQWYTIRMDDNLKMLFPPIKTMVPCYNYEMPKVIHKTTIDIWDIDRDMDTMFESGSEQRYKIYELSKKMADFINIPERRYIDKITILEKILEYIKVNNLQNPTNKVEFFPDEKLRNLLSP
jgi:hypothetical protein